MEIQHISPSSWQPLLCLALYEEVYSLYEFNSEADAVGNVLQYLNGRRGRGIMEILAIAQWKGLSDADNFLRMLTKVWKLAYQSFTRKRTIDRDGDGISLREFDILLASDGDGDLLNGGNIPGAFAARRCGCRFSDNRKGRVRVKKRKQLEKLRKTVNDPVSSSEDQARVGSNADKKNRRNRSSMAAGILGFPVVQEDSDGFPACWGDEGLATITEDARMTVDDIILPIIRAALPTKLKFDDDEPAVTLALLGCLIRKTLPFISPDDDTAAVWYFVDRFLGAIGAEDAHVLARCSGQKSAAEEESAFDPSARTLLALKRELLVRRHGVKTLISVLVSDKVVQFYELLINSTTFLLRNLKAICQSLSAAPLAVEYFELLRTEGCMEYLLEMAAEIIIGILRLVSGLVSTKNTMDGSVDERLATIEAILALCKEAGLDEMIRDVCIGLDLLATIDFSSTNVRYRSKLIVPLSRHHSSDRWNNDATRRNRDRGSESEARPYVDNVYYGKLYCILFQIVALIHSVQRLAATKSHLGMCSRLSHRSCCVSCQACHHNKASEFVTARDHSEASQVSNKCSIAFLEKIIFLCLKNVTAVESKQMCVEALESFPSCCCVSKIQFLTTLLEELAECSSKASETNLLLNCFTSRLGRETSSQRSHCQFCKQSAQSHSTAEFESSGMAWKHFMEKKPSDETKEMFFRAVYYAFPYLDASLQEKLACILAISLLSKWCIDREELLKSTKYQLPMNDLFLYSLLLGLCETGISSPGGYGQVVEQFSGYVEVLFHHPDTRTLILRFIRQMAMVEWIVFDGRISTNSKSGTDCFFNQFLFKKYHSIGKLILNDTQNFVSDAAWEYWLTSAALLETCRDLLAKTNPNNVFRLIFIEFGGLTHACQIVEVTAQAIVAGGSGFPKSAVEEKAGQRLAQLLSDTVGLCMVSGTSDEKILTFLAPLHSFIDHVANGKCQRKLAIVLAKRLLDEALKPYNLQQEEPDGSSWRHRRQQSIGSASCSSTDIVADGGDDLVLSNDEGYDADVEDDCSDTKTWRHSEQVEQLAETRSQARLFGICLQLILASTTSPEQKDDSAAIVVKAMKNYCTTREAFANMLLNEENFMELLLKLAEQVEGDVVEETRKATISLLFELFKCSPSRTNLKKMLTLFNQRSGVFQEPMLECFSNIFVATPFDPASYLKFPRAINGQLPVIRSVSSHATRRLRSMSPNMAGNVSVTTAAETTRTTRGSSALPTSNGPFAPFFSGLSSLFNFGSGSDAKPSAKKKPSAFHGITSAPTLVNVLDSPQTGASGTSVNEAFAVWPEAAVAFSMDDVAKNPASSGVSIGLWVYLKSEAKSTPGVPLHLLTCGDDSLACSLYLARGSTTLFVRLISGGALINEYARTKFLPLERWTHLLLVMSLSKTEQLTMKVFCDGAREAVWCVPWNSSETRNSLTSYLCLGSCVAKSSQEDCSYFLGNVAGFHGELSLEHSMVLRALGLQCVSVVDTKSRRLDGDLASFVNANLLLSRDQELKIAALMEDRLGLMEHLQKNQAFIFSPADADHVHIYPMDSSTATSSGNASAEQDSGALWAKVPFSKRCGVQATMDCETRSSLDDAVATLGGVKLFVFLFARCIEFERSEQCQALSLRLLLRMTSRNPEWWRTFADLQGYVVISRVLSTACCRRGYKLLESIFEFSLSVNVFRWPATHSASPFYSTSDLSSDNSKPDIVDIELAAIQDPFALTRFLLDSDIWKEPDGLVVWTMGLEIVLRLLTQTAPTVAAFNAYQLNKAKFLKYFFFALTERSQDTAARLSDGVATTIAAITASLIGSPPNLFELTSCWDFIFLTHPASSTYLNYRIGGPSDWLDPDSFVEPVARLDNYESKLGTKLRQFMNTFGKDTFIQWITSDDVGLSATGEARLQISGDATGEPTADFQQSPCSSSDVSLPYISTENLQHQQLPDLVCDIDPAAATVAMSDSIRTATQSDDDALLSDEGADALAADDGNVASVASINFALDAPWLVETRGALLNIIYNLLATSPAPVYSRIASPIVKWEHLLVMLRRQNNVVIRTACIKTLCMLLMRFNSDQRQQFLKANGFALLANQLREHPCLPETVDSLFTLLCGESVAIEDGLDIELLSKLSVDRFRAGVLKPILVAYQNSLDDVAVFWNLSIGLSRVLQYNGSLAQTMLELHVGEVLANILLQLSLRHHNETDLSGITESSLMIEGWRTLATIFMHRCVTRSNVLHHQAFSEILQLITSAVLVSKKFGMDAHLAVRKELCVLIQLGFESIRQSFGDGNAAANGAGLPFLSRMSSRVSTPLQSGRATPLLFADDTSRAWPAQNSTNGENVKITARESSNHAAASERRRSSLTTSLTNLKEKILSISQGNVAQILGDTEKTATQSELLDRWKMLLQYSTEYFMFFVANNCFEERHLFDYLLHFAINTLANDSGAKKRGNSWQSLMWSSRAKLQQFLSNMLVFVLYPAERNHSKLFTGGDCESSTTLGDDFCFHRRLLVAEALAHEPQMKSILKSALDAAQECQSVVTTAVFELLLCDYHLSEVDGSNCRKLAKLLRHLKLKSPFDDYGNADEIIHNVCLDERLTLEVYMGLRTKWLERMRNFSLRLRDRHQHSAQSLSDEAMSITCAVVTEQNLPRKLFIQFKKQIANDLLVAEENLRNLVTDLCHPAGSCFDVISWPANWRLDPTEGPNRERRRLVPAHLGIAEKFVLLENQEKLDAVNEKRPFVELLSGPSADSVAVSTIAGQLLERLRIEDKIIFNCTAVVIRTSFECQGELLLGDRAVYFVGESSRSSQKGIPLDSVISMNWPYHLVTALHRRYFQLIDLALEIFFAVGETYLVAFENTERRELFLSRLLAMNLPNLTVFSDHLLPTLTAWWREGNLTNFQYLMHLNTLAGRTFNDLMQYPVFPFILSDYTSLTLNLSSFAVYRNFAKPIAIQELQMESHYLQVYRSLDNDFKRNAKNLAATDGMPFIGAYHYGSHYSNSGVVLHYLVRLPPFTQLLLEYQDNNFDLPDRTFHSVSTAYRLSTSESTTDFKELIPEFFFLDEFLTNREGLNLGKRQNGQSISDVELPPWCPDADARLFILIHRQALESAYVSAHVHEWVDLIFGYKQTGQAAIDSINVFHPATYHGTLATAASSDEIKLKALNTMVKTYGQMPKQLFKAPHLPHLIAQNYLTSANKQPQSPLLSVNGIRWGHYVGSPELPEPTLVLKQRNHNSNVKPACLFALADGSCVGFPLKSIPLVVYSFVKKDLWLANVREVQRISALSWEFGDKVVRLRTVFPLDAPATTWVNAIALHNDEIVSCACCPGSSLLFLGLKTGVTLVYKFDVGAEGLKTCTLVRSLYGHSGSVTAIDVCSEYSVLVTGSDNGECFVWDYNRLNFINALRRHTGSVTHICISKTTGDVATVALKGWGSELALHTINGRVVGLIETDIVITSVAMSSAPEGTAVNCVATGMQNGLIRLWNMWTLAPIREICHTHFLEPIVGLVYSHNSLKMYACTKSGAVLCWDSGASKQVRPPRFFCLSVNV